MYGDNGMQSVRLINRQASNIRSSTTFLASKGKKMSKLKFFTGIKLGERLDLKARQRKLNESFSEQDLQNPVTAASVVEAHNNIAAKLNN